MGDNYYVVANHCESCCRNDEKFHIGKSSYGWAFTFRGYRHEGLDSWAAWKQYLLNLPAGEFVVDEYGDRHPVQEFMDMIEHGKMPHQKTNGRENLVHNEEGRAHGWFRPETDWDDPEGFSFTAGEFS